MQNGGRVNRRAGAFVQPGRGSTPMTRALWYAAADLMAPPFRLAIRAGQAADAVTGGADGHLAAQVEKGVDQLGQRRKPLPMDAVAGTRIGRIAPVANQEHLGVQVQPEGRARRGEGQRRPSTPILRT